MMKSLAMVGLLVVGLESRAASDLPHAPRAFDIPEGRAVFVDFETAHYAITYDTQRKSADVVSTINFLSPEEGHPVFDALSSVNEGIEISTPDQATKLKRLKDKLPAGRHTMVLHSKLSELVEFGRDGVKSAFWTTDLADRGFLEQYLPANFEFDRVKMSFEVRITGTTARHQIYTNGTVTELGQNSWLIEFPTGYTASSVFFHMVPQGSMLEVRDTYRSIDGREIPVVAYKKPGFLGGGSNALRRLKDDALDVLSELEKDYGAFPHNSVTIYNAGQGGMEYCGATITSASALGHELTHSYFARGIMPANGNAGWIDEAIASWRDEGYPRATSFSGTSQMSSRAYYTRSTDRAAYTFGMRFMSYLDGKLATQGGLKPFLREMVSKHTFAPYFTEDFVGLMGSFYNTSVEADFQRHTYGGKAHHEESRHPFHQKMGRAELKKHL